MTRRLEKESIRSVMLKHMTEKQPIPPCFVLVYIEKIHETVFRQLIKDDKKLILYAFNEAGYKHLPLSKQDQLLGCMVEAKWLAQ